ncbi:MAG: TonB-dependent receptor [Pseudomonadota bacterium]|nr:TonB-dependent receptor [Pseudomonadota bacterium]
MVKRGVCLALTSLLVAQAQAAHELSETDFLVELPTVLTASRLAQPLMDAPNSISVIDRKLIEASGYHNLSDLFRLVPGMYVGQEKGWFHNVSHTFADSYSRRMQVLVDGRSVYLPSFGGVRWDALPIAIDDIDRIEVVRGPNAATFGANAFTGVINILTRHPDDVAGRMLHVVTGDHGHAEGWFRWAGGAEASSHRLTLGRREDGGLMNQFDDERSNILSYRGDFSLAGQQALSLQLGLLDGTRGAGSAISQLEGLHNQEVDSYSLQADYKRPLSSAQTFQIKASLDHLQTREIIPAVSPPAVPVGSYLELNLLSRRWHGEFQLDTEHLDGLRSSLGVYSRRDEVQSLYFWNTSDKLIANSWGVFGHLEWRLDPHWLLNAGAFFEDYEPVGGRWSPRATVHWQPLPHHSLRFGISRAYRNPVQFETDADWRLKVYSPTGVALPLPVLSSYILASGNVKPEELVSHEIGYLGLWPELGASIDLRLFRERITDFIRAECTDQVTVPSPCSGVFPTKPRDFYNAGGATQQGFEVQIKWQATSNTQFLANYAYLHIDSEFEEKRYSPPHISGLHLMHRLPGEIDMTLSHYWVSSFRPIGQGVLPAYQRLDARLAKHFRLDGLRGQVALTWQNLTDAYLEFADANPDNLFDSRAYVHFQLDF